MSTTCSHEDLEVALVAKENPEIGLIASQVAIEFPIDKPDGSQALVKRTYVKLNTQVNGCCLVSTSANGTSRGLSTIKSCIL